jgi:DNA repair protein RadD
MQSYRKTIIFGATIAHCEEMARQFNAAGHNAKVFCATTKDEDRTAILREFNRSDSEIRILISVEALAKGFDVPDVSCVCDCRPLRKSLSTAMQMWGRGLRSSPETGKEDCMLLDFSGNIVRFADDFANIYFHGLDSLEMGEKLDKAIRKDDEEKGPTNCPKCEFSPMGKVCISCGYKPPVKQSTIEVHAGEMREFTLGGTKLADSEHHLYEQLCTHTRSYGKPETAPGRAYHLYREITGKQPDKEWRFDDACNVLITRNVSNKIKALRIAWSKSKRQHQA